MRITNMQLLWIMSIVHAYYAMNPVLLYARQDAWLSMLIGSLGAVVITYMLSKLSAGFGGHTIASYGQVLLGNLWGRLIVIPYLVSWFLSGTSSLREMGDFVNIALLRLTPIYIVLITMTILVIYLLQKGSLSAIARCAGAVGPLYLLVNYVALLMNIQNMDIRHLQPLVADTGWSAILKVSTTAAANIAQVSMIPLMFTAFVEKPKESSSYAVWGMALQAGWNVMAVIAIVLVFGPSLSAMPLYPVFALVRAISILDFIQSVDVFSVFVWMFQYFVNISIQCFMISYALKQLLNLSSWRYIGIAVPILMFVTVLLTLKFALITTVYRGFFEPYILMPVTLIGLPLLLWSILKVKARAI